MAVEKTKKAEKVDLTGVLNNWESCNDFLRNCSEQQAAELLELEKTGKKRMQYLLRIHARFNRERARRERSELLTKSGE